MNKLSKKIRKDVSNDYRGWGVLDYFQRKMIIQLCDLCDGFERAADNFALELQEVRNNKSWISVKDRLPEMYETVLVFCKGALSDFQCVSEMIEPNGKKWSAVCSFPVTHWQPLPEPPKEREEI